MLMMSPPSIGVATAELDLAARPRLRAEFAWEFLRRNPRYRRVALGHFKDQAAEEAAARAFGLQFLADPDACAQAAVIYWRADVAPACVVHLERARRAPPDMLDLRGGVRAQRRGADGLHLHFGGRLQGLVAQGDLGSPLAAVLPITGCFSEALRAATDLERQLRGEAIAPDLTAPQQLRLRRTLQAYDAAAASATYREIARDLFGEEAVGRHEWRTSSVRDTVIRLVRNGRALVSGGYRRLLSATTRQDGVPA
jgi:hypothetical protein